MTTQLPTWHDEPVPPAGSAASYHGQTRATGATPDLVPAAPGAIIGGRYSLRATIGHGGMGTVWRAGDTLLCRDVAVKEVLLPKGLATSERDLMYQRTLREARAAAALSHPSVVQVYDVVTENGRPWIVMELLQARSLAEMIMEDGPLAPRAVAKIGIALLGALEVAHAAGVLHRDVKPANVLICFDGRCVLTDFGVAHVPTDVALTTPGVVLGSPHFISPERAIGAPFGPPSDLFSLGVTLYTAVEGRAPFDKLDPFDTMRAVVEEPPAPPVRAGALTDVLFGLLDKDPTRRWDVPITRGVLRDLLTAALASQALPTHETDPYAVVPATPYTQLATPPPTGQIGGRAMLAPNESLSGALRRLQDAPSSSPDTGPTSHGAGPTLYGSGPTLYGPESAMPDGESEPPRHRRTAYSPDGGRTGRGPSTKAKIGLAAGATLALVLGVVAVARAASEPTRVGPVTATAPSVERPLIEVQEYRDTTRGFSLNVPHSWVKKAATSYVDFVDPADPSGRYLRINVETAGADSRQFMQVVERGMSAPGQCLAPFQSVALRDVQLAARPAAELEYTCGQGTQIRHGIWRAVVMDGRSYHFFLTVPDSRFTESRVIFDEMVRSFRLAV